MAKYKVGDIFINHNDGKILQVWEGGCDEGCFYNNNSFCKKPFTENTSCYSLMGSFCHVKELPFLPPGTKVKVREDLEIGKKYGKQAFVGSMAQNKEVTIKNYSAYYKAYDIAENNLSYSFEMFDQVINESKENNNMETKEIKINVPEGYEIDKENSTFECIKFKSVKKLTYEDVARKLFNNICYYTNERGKIIAPTGFSIVREDKNNATNKKQLERLLALNQLLNIAKYYNKHSAKDLYKTHIIRLNTSNNHYFVQKYEESLISTGIVVKFNREEDARTVIENPNFKTILDLVYKGYED